MFKKRRKKAKSSKKWGTLLLLCGGFALLLYIALVLANNTPLKLAMQSGTEQSAAAAYWQTAGVNPYGGSYPSPTACDMNYQNGGSSANCFQEFPGGVLSALNIATSQGTDTYGKFGVGGYAACYPSTGRYYGQGFEGAGTASPLVVGANSQVQLDWACQPKQSVTTYLACGDGWEYDSDGSIYSSSYMVDSQGTVYPPGSNALIGTASITTNWTPGTTVNFNLYCTTPAGVNQLNATVPVTYPLPPQPSIDITGNGTHGTAQNPVVITLGDSVTVAATYYASTGDALTKTAINDSTGMLWCGTGCTPDPSMWTQTPLSPKSYTFTPSAAGTYLFTPGVQTTYYPNWNNYNESLYIKVNGLCTNGVGVAGSCTACDPGYVLQGTAPTNSCVPECQNGNGPAGACTSCDSGFHLSSGECDANVCPGPHEINYPTCSCDTSSGYYPQSGSCQLRTSCSDPNATPPLCISCTSGYQMTNGTCTPIPPALSTFTATPTRVEKGGTTTFTWSGTYLPASCTLAANSAMNGFPMTVNSTPTGGSVSGIGPIVQQTGFTLTCGSTVMSTGVTTVPVYQEL